MSGAAPITDADAAHHDLPDAGPSPTAPGWELLRTTMRPQRRAVVRGIGYSLAWTLTKIAVPAVTRLAVDQGIVPGDRSRLLLWCAVITGLGIVSAACAGGRRVNAFTVSYRTEANLRHRLFAHLQTLPFAYHDRHPTGQLLANANTDLRSIEAFITMVPITLGNLVTMLGVTAVLLALDWQLALIALATLPFLNIIGRRFSHRLHPHNAGLQEELGRLSGVVEETLSGIRVVKGFGTEDRQDARLGSTADTVQRRALAATATRSRYLPVLDLLPQLSLAGVLWLGGHRVLDGHMSLGTLVAFNSYVLMVVWPLRSTGMVIAQAQRAGVAATRVAEVLSTEPELREASHPRHLPVRDGSSAVGEIRFEHVRFAYGTDHGDAAVVLDDLDLRIAPGEAVALVGATASGKTTLARLVPRFYDVTAGKVLIDGIDVRSVPLTELRRAVSFVFDETFLFSDTVRANLLFARPDATEDDMVRAARLAGADDFVRALPQGYDTVLAERGQSLSGGQRQRLAIARSIVADPRALILDDATSAVDPTKEHEIRAALREVMQGRTTIVIAHRAATIALADRVVLLDGGKIADTGSHLELLERNARYREVLARAEAGPDAPADGTAG